MKKITQQFALEISGGTSDIPSTPFSYTLAEESLDIVSGIRMTHLGRGLFVMESTNEDEPYLETLRITGKVSKKDQPFSIHAVYGPREVYMTVSRTGDCLVATGCYIIIPTG